jgi:hypothetical protein
MHLSLIWTFALALAQHPAMPPGMTHDEHLAQMKKETELKARGAAAMGFEQDAATHHFRITADGGAIEVTANRADDRATIDAIRSHLQTIATQFAEGRFDAPFATHGEVPPGAPVMQEQKNAITYRYEPVANGGRVRIVAANLDAVSAVHAFLRYQIREHKTGDTGQ